MSSLAQGTHQVKHMIPPESGYNGGTGQAWFGGVDLTGPPYYASLTKATKYPLLDGYTATQFNVSPQALVTSRPYAKSWVLPLVFRSIAPDNTRTTLMKSITALNKIFDPANGPQQLILAEFPGSYWLGQNISSKLDAEDVSSQMLEANINFACTGPAYCVNDSVVWQEVTQTRVTFTVNSNGDTFASPRWRFYAGGPHSLSTTYKFSNLTTGESVSWSGSFAFGDVLDFCMDQEYGGTRKCFLNGNDSMASVTGPAWPHLAPGENTIQFTQSTGNISGVIEVRWRDRFQGGLSVVPSTTSTNQVIPPVGVSIEGQDAPGYSSGIMGSYIFSGYVTDVYGDPIVGATVALMSNWENPSPYPANGINSIVSTDANGYYVFPATTPTIQYYHKSLVTADVDNNQSHVTVASVSGFKPGDNVCLVKGTDPTYYEEMTISSSWTGANPIVMSSNFSDTFAVADGSYCFKSLPLCYVAQYMGDSTHPAVFSEYISTLPPVGRIPTWLTIGASNTGNNYTFYGNLGLDIPPSTSYPIPNEPVYLQVSYIGDTNWSHWVIAPPVPASTWEDNPFATGSYTDVDGNFYTTYTVGQATAAVPTFYYRAWYPGSLMYGGSISSDASGDQQLITITGQPDPWPAQETPTPINYIVALGPAMISGLSSYPGVPNDGTGGGPQAFAALPGAHQLDYFAAMGFNTCYLVVPSGDWGLNPNAYPGHTAGTYDTWNWELAYIKSLGMQPVLDVCHASGDAWAANGHAGNFAAFEPYLKACVAAGWEYVADETGAAEWSGSGTGSASWIDFCVNVCGFKGVVFYNGGGCGLWPPSKAYGAYWMDTNVVLNNVEYYYTSIPPYAGVTITDTDAIETIAISGQQLGIPTGVLTGVWPDAPMQGVNNEPWKNIISGFGATWQSLIDWSYANGVGITTFGVWFQPDTPYQFLNYYLYCGFHEMVVSLQQTYPPANTEGLTPTYRMPSVTMDIDLAEGQYTFFGTLTDLITGNPIVGANVYLQSSPGTPTWNYANSPMGSTPVVTDANGKWHSPTSYALAAGQYSLRAWYAGGDAGPNGTTYLPTFYPYDGSGEQFTVGTGGVTATSITLTASPTNNPIINENYTLTATLTSSSTPLVGKTVSIYHMAPGGAVPDTTATTNASGVITFGPTSLPSVQTVAYFAYYSGDTTYQTATSSELDVTVGALSSVITLTVDDSTPDTGQTANFTINLSGGGVPITDQQVSIYYYLGGTEYADVNSPVITDISGNVVFSEIFPTTGAYTYYASFAGTNLYPAVTSSVLDLFVLTPTEIALTVDNPTPSLSQPFNLTATLTDTLSNPIASESVTIWHTAPESTTPVNDTTASTNASGVITYQTTQSTTAGVYTYYATVAVDETNFYDTSTSTPVTVTVASNTILTCNASSTSVNTGQTVTFTGTLTAGATGLASQPVAIYENSTSIATVTTDGSGNYTYTTAALSAAGTDLFYASYAGSLPTYQPATSSTVTVTVSAPAYTYLSAEGYITTNTSTGNQAVSLAFEPIAVLFWWVPQTGAGWGEDSQMGFGFAANSSPVGSGYISNAGHTGVDPSTEARKYNSAAAIGLVQFDQTGLGEATITFSSGGFTLNWTTQPVGAFALYYLAIGGTGYANAAVVPWTANTTNGNQTVTSAIGFTPSCVITIGTGDANASPSTIANSIYCIGAMDSAGNQWAKYGYAGNGLATTSTTSIQLTDSCIVGCGGGTSVLDKASYVSMNSGGFTINWTLSGSAYKFISLCLKGPIQVGHWSKTTAAATATDTITTTGITPVAVFTTNDCAIASTSVNTGYRLAVGASDGTNNGALIVTNKNGVTTDVVDKANNQFNSILVANTDTQVYDAVATVGNFTSGSFQATWTTNNNVATQICYVAIGH